MDEEELFKYEETRLDGAIRWQKRALGAEGKVVELEQELREGEALLPGMEARITAAVDRVIGQWKARVEVLESGAAWRRIDGPGIDCQRVMLRELDPFDRFNRGDENRDAIASGYWSDEYRHFVWPFGCTYHPPTHWAPMPDRLVDQNGKGGDDA